jgi:hypothetical protein
MRTTVRFEVLDPKIDKTTAASMRAYLSQPAIEFIEQFKEVALRQDVTLTQEELLNKARKLGVVTIEDLLGTFGFKSFEVVQAGETIVSIPLAQKSPNVQWVDGTE